MRTQILFLPQWVYVSLFYLKDEEYRHKMMRAAMSLSQEKECSIVTDTTVSIPISTDEATLLEFIIHGICDWRSGIQHFNMDNSSIYNDLVIKNGDRIHFVIDVGTAIGLYKFRLFRKDEKDINIAEFETCESSLFVKYEGVRCNNIHG